MITYDKQLFSSLSYWTSFAASFRTSAMFAVVISQLRNHAKVLHALWHDRRPTEFQHNDIMMKTPVQNDWDLRWHLGQCGLSVLKKVKQRTNWKQACMCIELCSDEHITLTTQIWINWPVSYKLMSETLRIPQSKRSSYCCTWSRDFSVSAISSTICGTGISTCGVCQHPGSYCVSQHPGSYGVYQHPGSHGIYQHPSSHGNWCICCVCFCSPVLPIVANIVLQIQLIRPVCCTRKFARAIGSRYVETDGFPVCFRMWLNSRIPLVCSSQHVACVWTVWFTWPAPVARAVVTTSVSEWSDTLWGHGQPNS